MNFLSKANSNVTSLLVRSVIKENKIQILDSTASDKICEVAGSFWDQQFLLFEHEFLCIRILFILILKKPSTVHHIQIHFCKI